MVACSAIFRGLLVPAILAGDDLTGDEQLRTPDELLGPES